ncbi:MAG: BlaI/MecI/CopY family transcriptional regulator [Acidobacteria bacterium]|nr:BlaI/MecI/CopY family transcriptional regulator [Acidobacteriota bacterium]
MKPRKSVPTDQELEILKVVWNRGSATVREVYEDFLKQRKIAYTTVLTMMGILEQKGHVTKTPGERAYVYSSAQTEQQVRSSMVKEFVDRVFNGSSRTLLVHLIENRELSPEELESLETLLKEQRGHES